MPDIRHQLLFFINTKQVMNNTKILFVIPDLQLGGSERVVSLMANHWAKQGHTVSIIIFNDQPAYYALHSNIALHSLHSAANKMGVFSKITNNLKRPVRYFKTIKKIRPDIIISFTDNANVFCLLYNFLVKKPLIITQRTNPYYCTLPPLLLKLPGLIYKSADGMVVQTEQTLELYKQLKITLPGTTVVIFNPLKDPLPPIDEYKQRDNIILAVGRLYNKDKHYDQLIDIFNEIDAKGWELHIAGDGPDKDKLQEQVRQLKLEGRVILRGAVKDIMPLYQQAKIFALTSQFEGFPNALCEAMANGCACISYDCPTGPAAIITPGKNGILVKLGDKAAFSKQLSALMNDESMIKNLSVAAYTIRETLHENNILAKWELLISEILKQRK